MHLSMSRRGIPGGGGTPIWNRRRCSSEILNLTPKGDHLEAWLALFVAPKGDQSGMSREIMAWVRHVQHIKGNQDCDT